MFSRANKDVLYDFLKREDIHWRKLNLHTAKEVYRQHALHHSQVRAYVLDDSIKARRGKKMEDVSSHYDHTTNRHVMGQQVLTLGLASEEAFMPLDSQIYVSSKNAQSLNRRHKDRRSVGAQRYREATTRTKPQMALGMMKRAKRCGVEADYLVADAWFGTKTMIRAAYELGVCAVLRMKKGAMKYRVSTGEGEVRMLDAKEIFRPEGQETMAQGARAAPGGRCRSRSKNSMCPRPSHLQRSGSGCSSCSCEGCTSLASPRWGRRIGRCSCAPTRRWR